MINSVVVSDPQFCNSAKQPSQAQISNHANSQKKSLI